MPDGPFFVTFSIARQLTRVKTPDHQHWTLDMIKDGFWITKDHAMCPETQGHYWIPPSQLIMIEKRE